MKVKKWSGSAWVQEYPEVDVDAIVASGTPSSSTFLRGDGAWAVPSAGSNNYLTGVSGSGDGTVTFTRSGLSNLTWDASHTHSEYALTTHNHNGTYAYYDHFRSLGTVTLNGGTTTSAIIGQIEGWNAFDSYGSMFKGSWSYAGNSDLSDAGRLTELAGTSWLTWTDNSSDSTRGNITALVIAPTTGGSANKAFIYNDQGSSYSPGWREIWTSASDGAGSGLDADLLDGQHGSYYAPKASPALTGTPTAPTAAANTNTTQIATTAYVQQEITDLIGGAPGALDTLNELAAAINDDASYASTITTALAGKMSTSHPANNHTSTHLYMANGDGFIWNDNTNVMSVRKDGTDYTNWDSGNLTNLNQLTNGPGYVTTDTNNYLTGVSGSGDGTVTFTRQGLGNLTWDASHTHSEYLTGNQLITLSGDVSGSGTTSIAVTVADDSHNHIISNVDGLQTALDGKASSSHNHSASEIVSGEMNTARLGSGTATSGYVLKSDGDGTASWQQDNNTTYTLGSFGVTATAAELNKMDGVTATTTELNYTDGVTSNIQTQLNGKAASSHSHGALTSSGTMGSTLTTVASGDKLVFADASNSNALVLSSIQFGSSTSSFLRNDGSWAEPGGGSGGYEPEWEYVTKVTGASQLTYSSMVPASYEYKFVVEVQTTAEDTSNPYIRINNESGNEYSYQYSSVTQTSETGETVLNAGDALTSLIYTGADLSSYSSGGTSASTIHRAEFIYAVSPYTTSPGAYTATIRGWAHTHYVSQSGTSYDGMVQSTFVGTRDNLFFTEHERLDYIHAINAGSTDYHEMRVYRRPRK